MRIRMARFMAEEQGEPVAHLTVQAWTYQYAEGKRSLVQVSTGQINDIGEYRRFWLPPGEYFVSLTMANGTGAGETRPPIRARHKRTPPAGSLQISFQRSARAGGFPDGLDGGALQRVVQALDGREPAQIYFPGTSNPIMQRRSNLARVSRCVRSISICARSGR
jgi:hypothetical protein